MSTAWLQRGATTALHAGPLRRLLPTADGDRPPSAAPGTGDDRKSEREGFDDASSLSPYPELSRCTPESRRHVPHTPLVPDGLLPSDRVPSPARPGAPSPPLPHDLVCGAAETVPADRRATLARGRERESPRALRGSTQPPVARPGASSLGLVGRVSGPRLSARSLPPATAPSGLARRPRAPQFRRHCQAWRRDLGAPRGPCPGGRASPVPEGWPSSGPYPRDQGQETCRRHRADQSPGGRAATWSCVPRWAPDGLPPPGSGGQRVSGERLDFHSDRDEDPGRVLWQPSAFAPAPPADPHGSPSFRRRRRSRWPPTLQGRLRSVPELSEKTSPARRRRRRAPAFHASSCSHPPHRLTHGTHTARTHHA